jgi:hypothetical protein
MSPCPCPLPPSVAPLAIVRLAIGILLVVIEAVVVRPIDATTVVPTSPLTPPASRLLSLVLS